MSEPCPNLVKTAELGRYAVRILTLFEKMAADRFFPSPNQYMSLRLKSTHGSVLILELLMRHDWGIKQQIPSIDDNIDLCNGLI